MRENVMRRCSINNYNDKPSEAMMDSIKGFLMQKKNHKVKGKSAVCAARNLLTTTFTL